MVVAVVLVAVEVPVVKSVDDAFKPGAVVESGVDDATSIGVAMSSVELAVLAVISAVVVAVLVATFISFFNNLLFMCLLFKNFFVFFEFLY